MASVRTNPNTPRAYALVVVGTKYEPVRNEAFDALLGAIVNEGERGAKQRAVIDAIQSPTPLMLLDNLRPCSREVS